MESSSSSPFSPVPVIISEHSNPDSPPSPTQPNSTARGGIGVGLHAETRLEAIARYEAMKSFPLVLGVPGFPYTPSRISPLLEDLYINLFTLCFFLVTSQD